MDPSDKKAGKFYQLLKVHQDFTGSKIPDGRPFLSGCGSITENIVTYNMLVNLEEVSMIE